MFIMSIVFMFFICVCLQEMDINNNQIQPDDLFVAAI